MGQIPYRDVLFRAFDIGRLRMIIASIIIIYSIAYVGMELLWLKMESACFFEDVIKPINWYSLRQSALSVIHLLFLPIIFIVLLGTFIYQGAPSYES